MGILILGVAVLLIGAGAILISQLVRNRNTIHPSELSSASRTILRPLRQAVEGFEAVVKANPEVDASKIIGSQAIETVRSTLVEASRLMPAREQLLLVARRQSSSAPQEAIDRIDQKIYAATQAVDQLTLKITAAATQTDFPTLNDQSDLPELVARLQNISQSFDEINQTIDQNQQS